MTYLNFLLIFIGIPITPLIYLAFNNTHQDKKYILKGILVLCGLAFFYTTPWDNYILAQKVWMYGPDRVMGVIGYVPIEEYAFFLIQTVFSGLWTLLVLTRTLEPKSIKTSAQEMTSKKDNSLSRSSLLSFANVNDPQIKWTKPLITLFLFGVFFYGVYALTEEKSFYIGLILAWATPVVLLQFIIGGQHLLVNKKVFLICAMVPTLYLWLIDYFAIYDQIWLISDQYTLGLKLGVLPLEEMAFFLITNIMVVQGLLLFLIMRDTVKEVTKKVFG